MPRIRRPSHATVVAYVALFVALGGGTTAVALSGHNTVQSDDIGPGAQVKAADIAPNAVAAPAWRVIGTAGQPAFHTTPDCAWRNYDSVHSTAAFTRDATGFVHLKGTVVGDDASLDNCRYGSDPTNQMIFVLPPGYRPQRREVMAVLTGATRGSTAADPGVVGTVAIDGPSISPLPAGAVSVDRKEVAYHQYFTLNGISFRCAPSGQNGCP